MHCILNKNFHYKILKLKSLKNFSNSFMDWTFECLRNGMTQEKNQISFLCLNDKKFVWTIKSEKIKSSRKCCCCFVFGQSSLKGTRDGKFLKKFQHYKKNYFFCEIKKIYF